MDPITGAVVALVIWLVLIGVGSIIFFWGSTLIGLAIGEEDGATIGAFIGWVLGIGWSVFALIQVILQAVNLIQLIIGG